jgi:hypothetical protein
MKMKKLPIGVSDFKYMVRDEYYYVDKTLFIKDVLDRCENGITAIGSGKRSFIIPGLSLISWEARETSLNPTGSIPRITKSWNPYFQKEEKNSNKNWNSSSGEKPSSRQFANKNLQL